MVADAGPEQNALRPEAFLGAADALLATARQQGTILRSIGGVAVAMRCATARPPGALARAYSDLDFVARRRDIKNITRAFSANDFAPARKFNAVAIGRLRFDNAAGIHVDVFLDEFRMCHVLDLSDRLGVHDETASLADLLLTKLQVAKLNTKDVSDMAALLADHPVTEDELGINVHYIAGLLRRDWGWWRTVTETLASLATQLPTLPLSDGRERTVRGQITAIEEAIEQTPKSLRWSARAKLGDLRPWREEPEDTA